MGAAARRQGSDRVVVVQRRIPASPAAVFAILASPARHHEFDGSGTVKAPASAPDTLSMGSTFSMNMRAGMPYRSTSRVVAFQQDREIAWETVGEVRGRKVVGGQIWRFEIIPDPLAPHDAGRCLVRHSYNWGATSGAPVISALGFPRRARVSMSESLERLAQAVSPI